MFLGTFLKPIDDRARVAFPTKYCEDLRPGIVLTKGQEHCLYVFTIKEFTMITNALRNVPITDKSMRDYSRVFFAAAYDTQPDSRNRIIIPVELRKYAALALSSDCVVIGANNRLEIWNPVGWNQYLTEQEDSFAAAAEETLRGIL
jgi:MraZ protein